MDEEEARLREELPKASMVVDYLMDYYWYDSEKLARNPLVAHAVQSPEYTPAQVYDIIDKVAIMNGIQKHDKEGT